MLNDFKISEIINDGISRLAHISAIPFIIGLFINWITNKFTFNLTKIKPQIAMKIILNVEQKDAANIMRNWPSFEGVDILIIFFNNQLLLKF